MENILLPIDLAHPEKTVEIMKEAKKYTEGREVGFTIAHIVSHMPGFMTAQLPGDFAQRALEDVQTRLEALVKDNGLDPSTEIVVRSGNPQHELVLLAKDKDIDLIIIASHQPGGLADYLLGSVAAAVVRHAPCSVLVKR